MYHSEDISIAILAERISTLSGQITSYLTSNSFSAPNFKPNGPATPETSENEALRAPLNDAALDLLRLVNGLKNTLQQLFFSQYDLAALQIALDRRFFECIPWPSEVLIDAGDLNSGKKPQGASVVEISHKSGMDVDHTGRVMKMLATHRIFAEVNSEGESETFTHTASSALLARDAGFCAMGDVCLDDMFAAASNASAAITHSPYISDASHSPFFDRYGATMYEYYEQQPEKAQWFGEAMSSWSQCELIAVHIELGDSG